MYTEKELLKLAGKLASACEELRRCTIFGLSGRMKEMFEVLDDYNSAIMSNVMEKDMN